MQNRAETALYAFVILFIVHELHTLYTIGTRERTSWIPVHRYALLDMDGEQLGLARIQVFACGTNV